MQGRRHKILRGTTLITAYAASQTPLTRAHAPVIPGRLGSGCRSRTRDLAPNDPSLRCLVSDSFRHCLSLFQLTNGIVPEIRDLSRIICAFSYDYLIEQFESFRPDLCQASLSDLTIHKVCSASVALPDANLSRKSFKQQYQA